MRGWVASRRDRVHGKNISNTGTHQALSHGLGTVRSTAPYRAANSRTVIHIGGVSAHTWDDLDYSRDSIGGLGSSEKRRFAKDPQIDMREV